MGQKQKEVKTRPENYEFVQCRSLGHNWQPRKADKSPLFGYYLWLECTECGMVRMDTINSYGRVGSRSYRQPEGYKNPGVPDRSEYRAVLLKKLTSSKDWQDQSDPRFELSDRAIERRLEIRKKLAGAK